jgi:hypothetical protein
VSRSRLLQNHTLRTTTSPQLSQKPQLQLLLSTLILKYTRVGQTPIPLLAIIEQDTDWRFPVLEARLEQADLLKKVVDAIKDLVQDCNFDCNDSGVALQAMDNSHVALVSMMLKAESFSPYRCDRNVALGVNLTSLTKVLRAAQSEDILTIKAEDAPDVLNLVFESSESDRLSEYDLKLMDIDQEHLGIPDTEYAATISMPSTDFRKICSDLILLSESGMHLCSLNYASLANVLAPQSQSKPPKTASSSPALVTLATVLLPSEAIPTSISQNSTSISSSPNPSP